MYHLRVIYKRLNYTNPQSLFPTVPVEHPVVSSHPLIRWFPLSFNLYFLPKKIPPVLLELTSSLSVLFWEVSVPIPSPSRPLYTYLLISHVSTLTSLYSAVSVSVSPNVSHRVAYGGQDLTLRPPIQ